MTDVVRFLGNELLMELGVRDSDEYMKVDREPLVLQHQRMADYHDFKRFVKNEITSLQQQRSAMDMTVRRRKSASSRRKQYVPIKKRQDLGESHHIPDHDWTELKTCCGFVLENKELSAVIIDMSTIAVCGDHHYQKISNPEVPKSSPMKKHHLYSKSNRNSISHALEPQTASAYNEKLNDVPAENNKFSDNSSDSGYEELASIAEPVSQSF